MAAKQKAIKGRNLRKAITSKGAWVPWLPKTWTICTKLTSGGQKHRCYQHKSGKVCWHKADVEKFEGRTLSDTDGVKKPLALPLEKKFASKGGGNAVVIMTKEQPKKQAEYIAARVSSADGMLLRELLDKFYYTYEGKPRHYTSADLKYDIDHGRIEVVSAESAEARAARRRRGRGGSEPAAAQAPVSKDAKDCRGSVSQKPLKLDCAKPAAKAVSLKRSAQQPPMKKVKKLLLKQAEKKSSANATPGAAKGSEQMRKKSLRNALVSMMKMKAVQAGRTDLEVNVRPDSHTKAMNATPAKMRAGYPVERKAGSKDPESWKTIEGKEVMIDFSREAWLPSDFAQGIKFTNPKAGSKGGSGGTYQVYMNSEGRTFYHRWQIEEVLGTKLGAQDGWKGQLRWAELQLKHVPLDSDASFFQTLSAHERSCLADKDAFHFCVVSARRADSMKSVKDLAVVQTAFTAAGVTPTWYVDEQSVEKYRALGLKAVVGGKLTPSRNMALRDARKMGKVCVQCSDDISTWEYRHGENATERTDDAMNAAHDKARRFSVSPVAAARFILAKMRGVPNSEKAPQLGGVYCLGSCARTFMGEPFSRQHFLLGDFFVVDKGSKHKFDESLTLKEDYDFTCSHIDTDGSVMRCNRMTINAKHYSNEGGACSNRDKKGLEEQKNMKILYKKWPQAIFPHRSRKNEVRLAWPKSKADA